MNDINEIKLITNKNPYWRRVFEFYYNKNREKNSINKIKNTFKIIIKYKNLIKEEITPDFAMSILPEGNKAEIEALEDEIIKLINQKKKEKVINDIKKSKYSFLFDENNEKLIKDIMEISGYESIDSDILKKIAKYKTKESLNFELIKHLENINNWNREFYLEKIKNLKGAKIIKDKNEKLLVEIENFEASQEIGSKDWCISYNIEHFRCYKNNLNRQYFLYDFNKNTLDKESMIGITVNCSGEVEDAYFRNDEYIEDLSKIKVKFKKLDKKIIKEYIKRKNIETKDDYLYFLAKFNQSKKIKKELKKIKENINLSKTFGELGLRNNYDLIYLLLNNKHIILNKVQVLNTIKIMTANNEKDLLKKIINKVNIEFLTKDLSEIFKFFMKSNDVNELVDFINIFRKNEQINNIIKSAAKFFISSELKREEENIVFLFYINKFENIENLNSIHDFKKKNNNLLKN